MTKRKPKQYRDERGRFAHASPEVRAGLEAMRPARITGVSGPFPDRIIPGGHEYMLTINVQPGASKPPYCDEIYRPKKIGWIERALHWLTWNRSLSAVWFAFCNKLFP